MLPDGPRMELYHKHILHDLNHIDARANNFLEHRLNFIDQKCQPVQQRIDQLKVQAEHYRQIQATHDDQVESRPDIKQLRADIAKFKETQEYYRRQLDQLEKTVFQVEENNNKLRQRIKQLKKECLDEKKSEITMTTRNNRQAPTALEQRSYSGGEVGNPSSPLYFPLVAASKRNNAYKSRPKVLAPASLHHSLSVHLNSSLEGLADNISMFNQKRGYLDEINSRAGQPTENTHIKKEGAKATILADEEQTQQKLKLHRLIRQFSRMDCLFTECLTAKKNTVQKMISQLQSKLVKKKSLFVKICQNLSNSEERKVRQQEFCALDGDEIVTLLVSFPNVYRRFNKFVSKKREQILSYSSLLK